MKKNIFPDPLLCNFMQPKTSDKLSNNIDHVYYTVNKEAKNTYKKSNKKED